MYPSPSLPVIIAQCPPGPMTSRQRPARNTPLVEQAGLLIASRENVHRREPWGISVRL